MITKKQYVEYLVSTPKNCTCTYLETIPNRGQI